MQCKQIINDLLPLKQKLNCKMRQLVGANKEFSFQCSFEIGNHGDSMLQLAEDGCAWSKI